ncbi:hypothetical protein [Campylobacter majalis]|uniref:hypothetical protein n=1 Tax=Campylobacter majalis TaxID=2790656 RepID=UPI003D692CEA
MSKAIIISMTKEGCYPLIDGVKSVFYRNHKFKNDFEKIYFYEPLPAGKIVGEADIDTIIISDKDSIWEDTAENFVISKASFFEFLKDKSNATAVKIKNAKRYEKSREISEFGKNLIPPQRFLYLDY